MTDREKHELQRLEVNVRRLVERVEWQMAQIEALRTALAEQTRQCERLESELAEAREARRLAEVAVSLGSSRGGNALAEAYLTDVINEIEHCIEQLDLG